MYGQHVLVRWSDDSGECWDGPSSPFVPPAIAGRAGLFRGCYLTAFEDNVVLAALIWVDNSVPEAPFFNTATEGLLDTRIFLCWWEGGGERWSTPRLVDTGAFDQPTPLTGPVLRLANGELACQFELNKAYEDTGPWVHKSVLIFSRDGGKTWPESSITSHDPADRVFYWDQRPAVVHDGRILDVFWTFDRKCAHYLNIHSRESLDHGRTWSSMRDLGVPGQPAQPVPLRDGNLALVYVDRSQAPAIICRVSTDGGRSWPMESETMIYSGVHAQTSAKSSLQDAWNEMEGFSMGLPATARLSPTSFLLVYYAGPQPDVTAVRWAVCAEQFP